MKQRKATDVVLGVSVTQQLIEAVLLQQTGDEVLVLRRFIRQRSRTQEFTTAKSLKQALPGLVGGDDADYSIDFGKSNGHLSGGGDVSFMASEFGGTKARKKEDLAAASVVNGGVDRRVLFAPQLAEILDECKAEGLDVTRIAFCIAPPDVSYTEVSAPAGERRGASSSEKKGGKKKAEKSLSRRVLLERLAELHPVAFDRERVAFLPMANAGNEPQYVALVPEPTESVAATLEALHAQERSLPTDRTLDADLAVLSRLARKTTPADRPDETTVIVRVGSDDTLVLFFRGRELRHFERLRSLSTHDAPETICSRVLLHQDEQKIGEVHHVLLLTEGRAEQLLAVFRRLYSEAAVETVQDALGGIGVRPPVNTEAIPSGSVPAVLAGLRLLQHWDVEDPDFAVHLLSKKLQHERKKLAFAWHTVLMIVVLLASAFIFSWRYMEQQTEIERQREEDRRNPVQLAVDNPALLRSRVDSLKAAHAKYTHALHVIDSLLVGSDRWTRLHERISRSTRDIGGIWLAGVEPLGGASIRIAGTATSRTQIAQFARRHEGSIEKASSMEIKHEKRDIRLYDFVVVAPVPSEMPRVALYLQEVADGHIRDVAVDSVLAAFEARSLYAPGHAPERSDTP